MCLGLSISNVIDSIDRTFHGVRFHEKAGIILFHDGDTGGIEYRGHAHDIAAIVERGATANVSSVDVLDVEASVIH